MNKIITKQYKIYKYKISYFLNKKENINYIFNKKKE